MNYRLFWLLLVIFTTLSAFGQVTQPCIVRQYNQKNPKTPLGGVELNVRDANSTVSGSNGMATLTFNTLKPGDKVTLRSATKAGYEIFNKDAIDQWNISRNQETFEIVLVKSDYFAQHKSSLTQSSAENYERTSRQAKAELAKLQQAGQLKEEESRQKISEREDEYDNALQNLDNYIGQFARIDMSEVSEEELPILEMVEQGQIDEAVKAYEALDISGKLRQARENMKSLTEAEERIKDEKANQAQAIAELKEKQQREIATLKLAGGKENFDKVARMLKENALADTTDINAVWGYAYFANEQKDYKESERFYLICLRACKDDLHQTATIQNNLGILYHYIHDYTKAEEYYLKALENYTQLFNQNPDAYRADLAMTLNNLGILYHYIHDYTKAEEYSLKALENRTQLFNKNPDAYRANLAMTQNNLGNLYSDIHDYTKAEEYYLKALENRTQLFNQNPDAYRADLAMTQNNLGNLYSDNHDYTKAEEFHLKALENFTQLFNQNPDAYRADLAMTQNNLGILYYNIHDYTKAEEFYLKALENFTQLFNQNPDAYRANLAMTQNNLGNLYSDIHDYTKAEEYYIKALENCMQLFNKNPEAHKADLANSYNSLAYSYANQKDFSKAIETIDKAIALQPEDANYYGSKGEILLMKGDEAGAVEMWNKVMALDPDFLSKQNGSTELYRQLKERGLIE